MRHNDRTTQSSRAGIKGLIREVAQKKNGGVGLTKSKEANRRLLGSNQNLASYE